MKEASGEFTITGGEEEAYSERGPGKLTRAGGTQDFSGDIEGKGRVEWLMCYLADGTAEYVGMQEIEGAVQGRKGSFVATLDHDDVLTPDALAEMVFCLAENPRADIIYSDHDMMEMNGQRVTP